MSQTEQRGKVQLYKPLRCWYTRPKDENGKPRVTFRPGSTLARAGMSTPEAERPPAKPELKQKPPVPSKPGTSPSQRASPMDKDTLNKNCGKVHEIVSKFNHHDPQPFAAGPGPGRKKRSKRAPPVRAKPEVVGVPLQVRAAQPPPLPLKRRQSQRKEAERNSYDVIDGRRSAPDGKEFEQRSVRSRPDQESQCEKNCTCICHMQRPGMKLVWVEITEGEEEEGERKQTDENMDNEEESESDEEAELDLYQSGSSESDSSLNGPQNANKSRFQATLNIIEQQLRRRSDPGPEAVLQSIRSLPQELPQLNKTHSVPEEESIYEATINLIVPPKNTIQKTSPVPEIHVDDSPPAVPPRVPLDKRRCLPRRSALASLPGVAQIQTPPGVDRSSSEHVHPVRPPPPPPPARATDRCLSSVSQTSKSEEEQSNGGDAENKEQRRPLGLTRQKSVDMEAQLPEELLYQIYTETYITREIRRQTVCRSISKTSADYSMDLGPPRISAGSSSGAESLRSSPISFQRTLWQDQPAVQESGILDTITPEECKYQESMFEVLTSEVSYLRSLRVLTDHFMESRELNDNIINRDRKTLFSNILRIREVSEKFLKDLEDRLDENLLLTDICDIVNYHAQHNFPAYIDYVRNQVYQEKTFSTLMQSNVGFATAIAHLQESPKCQRLPFSSFLLLPFQRITRIKILTENILKRTAVGTKQEEMASKALAAVSKIIEECNTQVGKMKQMEELIEINKMLEFDKLKAVPIISQNRFLEKRGELQEMQKSGTLFHTRPKLMPVYLFLFNDLLILATKKGAERYVVTDHAHRSLVQAHAMGEQAIGVNLEHCFCLTLLENHQGRMMERVFKAPSESDMHRWLAAFPNPEDPDREQEEVIYEDWDCPQVQCVEQYIATQADELNLEPPEIINVIRKTNEGWYEGTRLSDGQKGWFPVKNVLEITSEHMRRRNLRERYRVIQAACAITKTRTGS